MTRRSQWRGTSWRWWFTWRTVTTTRRLSLAPATRPASPTRPPQAPRSSGSRPWTRTWVATLKSVTLYTQVSSKAATILKSFIFARSFLASLWETFHPVANIHSRELPQPTNTDSDWKQRVQGCNDIPARWKCYCFSVCFSHHTLRWETSSPPERFAWTPEPDNFILLQYWKIFFFFLEIKARACSVSLIKERTSAFSLLKLGETNRVRVMKNWSNLQILLGLFFFLTVRNSSTFPLSCQELDEMIHSHTSFTFGWPGLVQPAELKLFKALQFINGVCASGFL